MINHTQFQKDLIIKFPTTRAFNTPKLNKIILDVSCSSELGLDKKHILNLTYFWLYSIGQFPKIKKAKKSVASFKLRQGVENGTTITLRNKAIFNFICFYNVLILPQIAITTDDSISLKGKLPKLRSNQNITGYTNLNYGLKSLFHLNINDSVLEMPINCPDYGSNLQFIFKTNTIHKESKLYIDTNKFTSQSQITFLKNKFLMSYYLFPVQ